MCLWADRPDGDCPGPRAAARWWCAGAGYLLPHNPTSIEYAIMCGAAWKASVIDVPARIRKKNIDIPFSSLPSLSQPA